MQFESCDNAYIYDDLCLVNCDYQELLCQLEAKNITLDCILTDPPYCVSRTHQLGFSNMGRAGMNFGKWDYDFNQKEWIPKCVSLLKNGGNIIIFNDWKNLSYLCESLEASGCIVKDLLRWEKLNPMPRNVNSRYVGDFELAIWAVKGKGKWVFNKPDNIAYLKPSFKSAVVQGGKNRLHPTQKHLGVLEEILRIHTNKGDLVLDPFSGSGTTALACLRNNRKFIGSEINKEYFIKAKKRLRDNQ